MYAINSVYVHNILLNCRGCEFRTLFRKHKILNYLKNNNKSWKRKLKILCNNMHTLKCIRNILKYVK